ncbi:hypothetical protein GCM10025868_14760 [Angustibacter aerolatus]|uniref:Uncharacterized protein n=1 Tax=Angustibacter aerolatus TaxID=1162965 RepID=A0ABQ6JHI7_9ACTN|nr:hypothetical protein GCM10025868_14760 [Angustibacter aerolatus]
MPSGSLDADPSAVTARSVAETEAEATGFWFTGGFATVTERVVLAVPPELSVTVSVTV